MQRKRNMNIGTWNIHNFYKRRTTTRKYRNGHNSSSGKHELGFVIREDRVQNILEFKPISEIICYIRLKRQWYNISFISAHAPTEEKDEATKDAFYDALERTIDTIPKQDMQLVCQDRQRA